MCETGCSSMVLSHDCTSEPLEEALKVQLLQPHFTPITQNLWHGTQSRLKHTSLLETTWS
jgi:hypothetical protein